MENSKVSSVLLALNKWKRKSLGKFVQTANVNNVQELTVLYKILDDCVEKKTEIPSKEIIYKKIHPKQTYNDQQMRLYMSYLFKLVEKFLIMEQIEDDPFLQKIKLMDAYNNLNQHKNFYKTYEDNFFTPTKGFFIFSGYDIHPTNQKTVKIIRPLLRYDFMTDNNKGYKSEIGNYVTNDVARSRITGGVTLCMDKPFLNDIRLSYEKYFYKNGIENNDDKFVIEFVVRF